MPNEPKTVIVTGASQGIGAAIVKTFLERSYSVVATSRDMTKSGAFAASDKLALVDGDIGASATAATIAQVAMSKFGSIDVLINNAGIFILKPFIDYTPRTSKLSPRPTWKASSTSANSRSNRCWRKRLAEASSA